jgi:hypothetical protein
LAEASPHCTGHAARPCATMGGPTSATPTTSRATRQWGRAWPGVGLGWHCKHPIEAASGPKQCGIDGCAPQVFS